MSLELVESMDLHWVADAAGHYQDNLCRAWTDAFDDFAYIPHPQTDDLSAVMQRIVMDYPDLARFDVYAAGKPAELETAREWFLKQGLPTQSWFAGVLEHPGAKE